MKSAVRHSAFTLIELLVVIAIVGVLAAITLPTLKNFRGADATLAATRQLLDEVGRARQLAISQRTTVYMVFCPANYWYNLPPALANTQAATNLFDKQLTGYTFITLRGVGDQPGQPVVRYLSPWRSLPDGAFIPSWKFNEWNALNPERTLTNYTSYTPLTFELISVYGFRYSDKIPFPSETSPVVGLRLPYIAFNYQGQLESGVDEIIPLARGSVQHSRNAKKVPQPNPPSLVEQPPGNSTNAFSLIHIDKLTGRARLERQEIK